MSITKELEDRLRQIPVFQKFRLEASDLKEGTARLTAPYDPTYNGVFNCFHGRAADDVGPYCRLRCRVDRSRGRRCHYDNGHEYPLPASCHSDAIAEAKIIKVGKTLCPVSVEVRDAQQVLVAEAQVTYMRLR